MIFEYVFATHFLFRNELKTFEKIARNGDAAASTISEPTDVPIDVEIAFARILEEAFATPCPTITVLGTNANGGIFLFVSVRNMVLGTNLGSSSSDSSSLTFSLIPFLSPNSKVGDCGCELFEPESEELVWNWFELLEFFN